MALSLANAISDIRGFLNEDTEVFWSDTEITQWIQEGCRDFSTKSLMIESSGDITLVAGQISYTSADEAFIANILEPYSALYNDGSDNWKGIIKAHPRMIGNESVNTAGEPRYYSLHNRTIYIWPAPTAAMVVAGAYITLLHSIETDDITALKDEYQHIPMMYARAMCLYKDKKFAEANALMSIYATYTNFERQDKHGREQDTLDMFKIKPKGGERGAA